MPASQDVAHLEMTCSGRGVCVSGECECDEGFTGIACERSKKLSELCALMLFLLFPSYCAITKLVILPFLQQQNAGIIAATMEDV